MQTDMHYYGTYAIARAAGLIAPAAQRIATAAEFVDDSDYVDVQLGDGVFIHAPPTAHHPSNTENAQHVDQRRVWVPFHFLPGNEGESFDERLVCVKDGALAREVVEFHLAGANNDYILERMGIAAHVYADTFSHYGFSGIGSPLNAIVASSIRLDVHDPDIEEYIARKASDFVDKYLKGKIAGLIHLGHGAAATYPDRPYLEWSFRYASPERESGPRRNQATFIEGAERLHGVFRRLAEAMPDVAETPRSFESIRPAVAKILAVEGDKPTRSDAWCTAASQGALFGPSTGEEIPRYDSRVFSRDVALMQQHTRESVRGTDGFAFLQAARIHRDYVLGELLPKHDLSVLESM